MIRSEWVCWTAYGGTLAVTCQELRSANLPGSVKWLNSVLASTPLPAARDPFPLKGWISGSRFEWIASRPATAIPMVQCAIRYRHDLAVPILVGLIVDGAASAVATPAGRLGIWIVRCWWPVGGLWDGFHEFGNLFAVPS